MKIKYILAALLFVSFFSCKKDNSNPVSQYAGTWIGTYTGNWDSGNWTISIAPDGTVSGTEYSTTFSQSFAITGNIAANGQITMAAGATSPGTLFTGNLTASSASGTWINNANNPPYTGTWTGMKQM
jgi:hypothetical protein